MAGCSTGPIAGTPSGALYIDNPGEQDVQCAALVFDPPSLQDERPLDLMRDERQPMAILGYQEQVLIFSDVQIRDHERFDNGDSHYDRRANSQTFSITTR